MYKIKITGELKDSIFGNFEAKYLNKEPREIKSAGAYGSNIELTVNEGNDIIVDSSAVRDKLEVGSTYAVSGVLFIVALNPKMGASLCITKIVA